MVKKIVLMIADITTVAADVIVNSANQCMLAGSGLCGAIHKKAGEELSEACKALNKQNRTYPVGTALVTPAGKLPARHVIHAVGSKWFESDDKKAELLRTYSNVLSVAEGLNAKILSIPTISTGIHKYSEQFAAEVVMGLLVKELPNYTSLETILIACGNVSNALAYKKAIIENEGAAVLIVDLIPDLD